MRPPAGAGPSTFGGAVSDTAPSAYRNNLEAVAGMLRALGHNAAATPSGPVPGIPDQNALLEQCRQAAAFIRHCGHNAEHYRRRAADNPSAAVLAGAYEAAMRRAATVHRHLGAAVDLAIQCTTGTPAKPGSPAAELRRRQAEHTGIALESAERYATQGAEEVRVFTNRLAPVPQEAPVKAAHAPAPAATAPTRNRR